MRVALDLQLAVGTGTGIGEYAAGLASGLEAAGVDVIRMAYPRLDPWRFDRRVLWDQALLPLAAVLARADILHCASGTLPLVAALGPRRGPLVVTVHDVAWLRAQQHTRVYARAYFGALMARLYPRADAIAVDSEFSRGELLALIAADPARVRVVYPGVAPAFAAVARRPGEAPAILAVGTVERRKNLAVAIEALASLPGVRLISVGPSTPYRDACAELARRLGVSGRVEFRGYVSREALLDLYATCTVAVVPSIYEGFGYAVAQALCAGLPVVAAATSSLPEIAAGDAMLVDAYDSGAWAAALASIVADPGAAQSRANAVRERSVARFSWRNGARATLELYRDALIDW